MSSSGSSPAPGSFEDEAFAVATETYTRESGDWERAVQVAVGRLFAFLADHPDQTNACIVGSHGVGEPALGRRDRLIARFTSLLLQQGFQREGAPPPVVAEAIGGGIYEIVRGHVLERRLSELPAAAPAATVVALSPFVGPPRAQQLAESENVQAAR